MSNELTLKSYELNPLFEALQKLNERDWSPALGYKLSKIKKAVAPHVEDFEESRQELVQEYAKKDEDGNPIPAQDTDGNTLDGQVQIEDMQSLYSDLFDLGQEDVSFDLPVALAIEDFADEDVKLKGEVMEGLLPILDLDSDN